MFVLSARVLVLNLLAQKCMQKFKQLVLWGIATTLAISAVAADGGPVTRRGSSVLHYMTRTVVSAPDTAPGASGTLRLQEKAQGNSSKQTLDLSVSGLVPGDTYTLAAVVGEDPASVAVSTVTANSRGTARVSYSGKGKKAVLPELLDPLSAVRAISLVDSNDQTVAYAWIADSAVYQYQVKRNLTPADAEGTAAGSISLKASADHVNFKLLAGGLAAATEYQLALNDVVVATATTDDNGRLTISAWPETAPSVFDLRLLEILDGASAPVLSTTFLE